jgi:hypothetical protein
VLLAAEENGAVEVFDLSTNELIHTISGLKAPHSLVDRADFKKMVCCRCWHWRSEGLSG